MNSPEVDAVLRLRLRDRGRSPWGSQVPEPREGRHKLGLTGLGGLLEVGGLQALLGGGSLGGVVPEQGEGEGRGKKRGNIYSHQEEVEQSQAGSGEPGELVLQVVVGLLLQTELL